MVCSSVKLISRATLKKAAKILKSRIRVTNGLRSLLKTPFCFVDNFCLFCFIAIFREYELLQQGMFGGGCTTIVCDDPMATICSHIQIVDRLMSSQRLFQCGTIVLDDLQDNRIWGWFGLRDAKCLEICTGNLNLLHKGV